MKLRLFSAMLAVTVALAVLLIGCGEYGSDPNADSGGVEREPVGASDFGGAAPNQNGPAEHSRPTAGYTHSYDTEAFIKEFDLVAFVVLWDHDFSAENNRDLAILHNDDVVEPCSKESCDPFTGDSVGHTVTWNGDAGIPTSHGRGTWRKLRFFLRDAELFSFHFTDSLEEENRHDYNPPRGT